MPQINTDSTDFGSHIVPLFAGLASCCSTDQNKLKSLHSDLQKKEELKRKLDELSTPFSDNQAYHAFLEMGRVAAGMGKSKPERK